MEKSRGIWFWIILIFIFVLYCLAWRRPFCQTTDQEAINQAIEAIKASHPGVTPPTPANSDERYQTPELFTPDTAVAIKSIPSKEAGTGRDSAKAEFPSWIPNDTVQNIPRPSTEIPRPFGYDVFTAADGDPTDAYATVAPEEYRLGTGDNLLVNLWGRVDLELQLTIDRTGQVFIPKAGALTLDGMTLAAAREAIKSKLESVYSNFELSVMLGQMRTFRVFVFGEVRRPGAYTVKATATLVDALYRSGGPNERGTLRRVRLVRENGTQTVDLYDFLLTGRRNDDPRLQAGDAIFVDVVGPRAVARGRVKRPGIYELKESTTLRDFIELAGGFDADAYRDRVMIDRLQDNDGRVLIDVNLANDAEGDGWSTPVFDGDDISVFSMFEMRPNVVWLEGWVKHPGAFERSDSMRVGDLIDMGAQLKPDAHLRRADLLRKSEEGGWQITAVDLGAILDGDGNADVFLQNGDRLTVYALEEVQRPKYVTIEGQVSRPGQYTLYEAMRLSDLVFRAGNPTREAYLKEVEVARRISNSQTKTISCDLDQIINRGDLAADILLEDGDYVFVRSDPFYRDHRLVTIEGEVRFPGRYPLLRDDESFFAVLERAGGLTTRAFPQGTVFIRQEISKEAKQRNIGQILINSQPLQRDSTGRIYREQLLDFNPESMTRIIIDVPRILAENGGISDVVMRHGDKVFIPAEPSGVQVLGAVASPGTIGFGQDWKVKDYIARAGGTTRSSDYEETRLIKADGQVINCSRRNIHVDLGDAIFVPPRVEKRTDWLRTITQGASIVGGLATTVLVVHSLSN
ncbi:MAG: SLBB domain-containing protein [Candidatus Zixiibacteriota bacterium]